MNTTTKKLLIGFVALLFATSCKFNSEVQKTDQNIIEDSNQEVSIQPLDGYFYTSRDSEEKAFIVTESEFKTLFNAAATMSRIPRKVDFSKETVGAIVLPETEYATDIELGNAYISDKVLHIVYSIKKEDEKRSFTILPAKLFTFDSSLDIDSVVFDKKDTL